MKPRVAITLGDPAGIGPEIVALALRNSQVQACCQPIVVGDPLAFALHGQALPQTEMLAVPGLNKKIPLGKPSREAGLSAIESLRIALGLLEARQAQAVVTAPVSKEVFALADLRFPGHTEWLAAQTKAKQVAMLMVAGSLRALLLTRHISLRQVASALSVSVIEESAPLAADFVRQALGESRPKLVLCGLNPHAGDNGLLGDEEKTVLIPALKRLKRAGLTVAGPIGADSAFRDMVKGRYHVALAAYHDQGMIPLKVYAPERLVNITLGLPFVRTSPGHGTAYDIAGKGRADPRPMIEAIRLAAQYAR